MNVKPYQRLYFALPLKPRLQIKGMKRLGYWLNLRHPQTFNEKINAFKLSGWAAQHVRCADKIAVRDYVAELGYQSILVEGHAFSKAFTYEELEAALTQFGSLFLKANHNSGPVFCVERCDTTTQKKLAHAAVSRQLKQPYGDWNGELWYNEVTPQGLCEKTLKDRDGRLPADYKFHVFSANGDQKVLLQYDYDRFEDHARTVFSEDLEMLPYSIQYKNKFRRLQRPEGYDQMLVIAKALAKGFWYARVDLYNVDGRIYFGEITFAPDGGFARFSERRFDHEWGALLG